MDIFKPFYAIFFQFNEWKKFLSFLSFSWFYLLQGIRYALSKPGLDSMKRKKVLFVVRKLQNYVHLAGHPFEVALLFLLVLWPLIFLNIGTKFSSYSFSSWLSVHYEAVYWWNLARSFPSFSCFSAWVQWQIWKVCFICLFRQCSVGCSFGSTKHKCNSLQSQGEPAFSVYCIWILRRSQRACSIKLLLVRLLLFPCDCNFFGVLINPSLGIVFWIYAR